MSALVVVPIVLGALCCAGCLFFVGMRRNWRPVLNGVRRASRRAKPIVLRSAGGTHSPNSVVEHVGRKSGKSYRTPVVAAATPDGFAIALPYGRQSDWLQNVLATGTATLRTGGKAYGVDRPEIVALAEVDAYFRPKERRLHRQFKVAEALRVRNASVPEITATHRLTAASR